MKLPLRKIRITLGYSLSILILLFISFYFWAGSGFYDREQYYKIDQYQFDQFTSKDTLKIMTYNLGYLSGMTNNLAVGRSYPFIYQNLMNAKRFLLNQKVDILAVQEIDFHSNRSHYFNQLDSLAIRGRYPFSAQAVNWDKSYVPFPYWPIKYQFGKLLSGQAILSKVPIINQHVTVLNKPKSAPFYYNKFYLDRLVQLAFIKVNTEDTLVIMNVHLEAFDSETRSDQVATVTSLFKKYSANFPVILLGDFNSIPPFGNESKDQSSIASLYELENISEAISQENYLANKESFFTFDSHEPFERLDYIFYTSNRIKKIDAGVAIEAGEISDHLPVWMTFTLIK